MARSQFSQLEQDLTILGKDAVLSLTQRQKIRDRLFKQIGQLDLIDAMQTKTEAVGLVMPVNKLASIFRPQKIMLGLPATVGLIATVFVATFTTGAIARDADPGQPLFVVRKAFETIELALTRDPARRAEVQLTIADERLQAISGADQTKLDAVVKESQKALESAKNAVSALQKTDTASTSSVDLVAKLKSLVDAQKTILSTIVKENIGKEDVRKSVAAIRQELDDLLPSDEAAGPNNSFSGVLTTAYGQPAINTNGTVYRLLGVDVDISAYVGLVNANVIGELGEEGIVVQKITIDSKLIGWYPSKDNNALPRVEGEQNNSLGQVSE
ncbi:MAG: hypothetical protein VE98_C0001G0449 [candidate division Kazan bacterium GW2011_GWA1_50_15]|uniref:DUF5667 domain-containing protein n=2 Tax=Bacteria division Kazan-3B-28 TaxID=1798534 RepID=A0A0G2A4H8_UNCK3|nr:MAG: hypothetical protein VE98_C0001G0449 [candidate division Kazan bacterium GW2011_GWA1_50_15]KKW25862.1 MAG: hypothetical protein VE99_C0001G0501 [candidate division Kazan bacterium GW2011_GWC1_52_13]KKW27124.1 MAG: hypothetical protein VF00_C0001G0059 [candidate division Kazan bacterium GW2011_GWB1_52_7]HCR42412.1 hypothetical protein [Patescibacteria group bacterium]